MTPLQKGRFPQFSVQKWGKVVKNDINCRPKVKHFVRLLRPIRSGFVTIYENEILAEPIILLRSRTYSAN